MDPQISIDVPPYLRVHTNGTVERLAGIHVVPPGIDPQTNVISKDITILPKTGVTARLYSPTKTSAKLPLILYFHGGAYCISSSSDPLYHNSLNNLVAEANIIAISVNYRLAPEHPLPTAYNDSWEALQWVASHAVEDGEGFDGQMKENWIKEKVDFDRVFLAGDSAGANIGHYMCLKDHNFINFKILGLIMVNPYFWGKEPIGIEISDYERKKMVDKWWEFVCPSDKGNDDPLINPFVEEAPGIEGLCVEKVLVTVAEKDILKERGKLYHKKLVNSSWKGSAEFYETQEEDHVFHIFNPDCDKAKSLIKRIAVFINEQ
ncbi:unnamed protein product [Vicia faba]|uniref:Alpha/beta hydrolase fold-3 domain-containing protein n=1 Tax=Vicia faba TaxID=3906 RepID=A0AAV0ZQJ0_VICFA|nr:unnamed protein product [Vicia faba]